VFAVVKGAGAYLDCEVVWRWGGLGDGIEGEAEESQWLALLELLSSQDFWFENCSLRVVNLPWFPLDLFDCKSSRHY
jgi:hypothetical protein